MAYQVKVNPDSRTDSLLDHKTIQRDNIVNEIYTKYNKDIKKMLNEIGADSFDSLVKSIPDEIRFKDSFNIGEALSEYELILETSKLKIITCYVLWEMEFTIITFQV